MSTSLPAASQVQEYFEYRFPFPIELDARQSALLPFLNRTIEAERVSIVNAGDDPNHPVHGAWLRNDSGVPLEPGPVTFFQDGRYAGEAVLDTTSRGERRLVSYGVDYDVEISRDQAAAPATTVCLTVARGTAVFHRETVETTRYRLKNKAEERRVVLIEHPREAQRELKDAPPFETTAGFYRFRIELARDQELEFPVAEVVSRRDVRVGPRPRSEPSGSLLFGSGDAARAPSEARSHCGRSSRA